MPEVVPGERRDAVAVLETEALQCVRKLACPRECLTKRIPVPRVIDRERHDLLSRMLLLRVPQDAADQERPIHHLSEHASPPEMARTIVCRPSIPDILSGQAMRWQIA